MSNDKDNPVTNISIMNDKIFIKEFSKEFYQKIIDIKDINTFEITLKKWIKNLDKNIKSILELMKNHNKNELLFSSIIGFFYQYGIGCNIDKNKALKLYLLAVNNNEKSLNESFEHLQFSEKEENDNEFDIIQNNNIIIGKYLLSLFYYKDIILGIKTLGYRYHYGQGVVQNYKKAFKWYLKSAKYGCAENQYSLGLCYKNGIGIDKDYDKAFKWNS
ncbi:unnamed protein product [Rhizophagus irregularis]|nr:unnamed protein product [Rhizophagus irregularis]